MMIVADTESQHVPGVKKFLFSLLLELAAKAESLAYSQVDVEIGCSQVLLCLPFTVQVFLANYILLS